MSRPLRTFVCSLNTIVEKQLFRISLLSQITLLLKDDT